MKLNHSLEAIASVADQALVSGGSFFLIVIASKYLSIEQLGLLGYIISLYIATNLLNTAVIFQDLNVEYPKYYDKNGIYKTALKAQFILSIIFSLVLSVFYLFIEVELDRLVDFDLILLIALFFMLQQLADFVRKTSYIFFNAIMAMIVSLLIYPVRIGLILFLKPESLTSLVVILIGTSMLAFVPLFYQFSEFRRYKSRKKFRYNYSDHFNRVKWLILSIPFAWLWAYLPVFMLGKIVDLKSAGLFVALRSITNVGNIFMEAMETKLAAFFGRLHHSNVNKFVKNIGYTKIAGVFLWGVIFIFLITFNQYILNKIYDNRFAAYSDLLPVLWVVQLFVFGIKLNAIQIRTEGKTRKIIFMPYFIGTFVYAILGIYLIKTYTIIGAIVALILTSITIYLTMVILKHTTR